jgi:hypothetical protein
MLLVSPQVNATNVNVTCGSRLTAPAYNQSCSSVNVYTGAQLMQAIQDSLNWTTGGRGRGLQVRESSYIMSSSCSRL